MNDKGTCGECGAVSFLDDCEQSTDLFDDDVEVLFECPNCEEGYLSDFDVATREEIIVRRCMLILDKIYNWLGGAYNWLYKIYNWLHVKYWAAIHWLNDAFHPGRQKNNRKKISHLRRRLDDVISRNNNLNDRIMELHRFIEKDVIRAVDVLAMRVSVDVREIAVPTMRYPEQWLDSDLPSDDPSIEHIIVEENTVMARMRILDCHDLKKLRLASKKDSYTYSGFVAEALARVLTPFVMRELFDEQHSNM